MRNSLIRAIRDSLISFLDKLVDTKGILHKNTQISWNNSHQVFFRILLVEFWRRYVPSDTFQKSSLILFLHCQIK